MRTHEKTTVHQASVMSHMLSLVCQDICCWTANK